MTNIADYVRTIPDFPKPGIVFYDITTILQNGPAFKEAVRQLAGKISAWGHVDAIAAPEARGFIFAAPLAVELGAGLIAVRKPGKLPWKTVSKSYDLEYGSNTVQMNIDAVKKSDRIVLVDDLLATGGTMEACRELVAENGGEVVGAAFVMELLSLEGRKRIKLDNIETLLQYEY